MFSIQKDALLKRNLLIEIFQCEWLSHWVQMQNIPNKEKMSSLEGTINDLHQFHFIAKDIMKTMWLRLYTKYRDARVKPTNTIITQQRSFTLRLPKNNQPTSCYTAIWMWHNAIAVALALISVILWFSVDCCQCLGAHCVCVNFTSNLTFICSEIFLYTTGKATLLFQSAYNTNLYVGFRSDMDPKAPPTSNNNKNGGR